MTSLRFLSLFLFAFSLSLYSPLGNSAPPVIHSVVYESDKVIISGGDFGAAPHIIAFDNFDTESNIKNILIEKNNSWHTNILKKIDLKGNASHQPNRNKYFDKNGASAKDMAQLTIEFDAVYRDVFLSFSVAVPKGTTFAGSSVEREFPNISSWKLSWLMLGKNGFQDENFDVCIPSHVGNGSFVLGGNDGNISWLRHGNEWWDWDNYNHFSSFISFDQEIPTNAEVDFNFSVNNTVTYYETSGKIPASRLSSSRLGFDRVLFPGWWGNGDNTNFDALYDNIYVAVGKNALARIVLSDAPSIAKSNTLITIPALEWKNGEIVLEQSNIPSDQGYYLHIYNTAGEKSREENRICPKCPAFERS